MLYSAFRKRGLIKNPTNCRGESAATFYRSSIIPGYYSYNTDLRIKFNPHTSQLIHPPRSEHFSDSSAYTQTLYVIGTASNEKKNASCEGSEQKHSEVLQRKRAAILSVERATNAIAVCVWGGRKRDEPEDGTGETDIH